MADLSTKTVAVICTHGFDDAEFAEPIKAVKGAGATVQVVAPKKETLEGKKGSTAEVDVTTADAVGTDFDAVILPGGTGNADKIRMDESAVEIVKKHVEAGKPLGVICHGGWILTDADVLRGKTVTSYSSIKTDLKNAGANWVDEEVVVDGNIVSSRTPADLEAFNKAIVEEFGKA